MVAFPFRIMVLPPVAVVTTVVNFAVTVAPETGCGGFLRTALSNQLPPAGQPPSI